MITLGALLMVLVLAVEDIVSSAVRIPGWGYVLLLLFVIGCAVADEEIGKEKVWQKRVQIQRAGDNATQIQVSDSRQDIDSGEEW